MVQHDSLVAWSYTIFIKINCKNKKRRTACINLILLIEKKRHFKRNLNIFLLIMASAYLCM